MAKSITIYNYLATEKHSLFKSIEEKVNKPLTEQVLIFSLSFDD